MSDNSNSMMGRRIPFSVVNKRFAVSPSYMKQCRENGSPIYVERDLSCSSMTFRSGVPSSSRSSAESSYSTLVEQFRNKTDPAGAETKVKPKLRKITISLKSESKAQPNLVKPGNSQNVTIHQNSRSESQDEERLRCLVSRGSSYLNRSRSISAETGKENSTAASNLNLTTKDSQAVFKDPDTKPRVKVKIKRRTENSKDFPVTRPRENNGRSKKGKIGFTFILPVAYSNTDKRALKFEHKNNQGRKKVEALNYNQVGIKADTDDNDDQAAHEDCRKDDNHPKDELKVERSEAEHNTETADEQHCKVDVNNNTDSLQRGSVGNGDDEKEPTVAYDGISQQEILKSKAPQLDDSKAQKSEQQKNVWTHALKVEHHPAIMSGENILHRLKHFSMVLGDLAEKGQSLKIKARVIKASNHVLDAFGEISAFNADEILSPDELSGTKGLNETRRLALTNLIVRTRQSKKLHEKLLLLRFLLRFLTFNDGSDIVQRILEQTQEMDGKPFHRTTQETFGVLAEPRHMMNFSYSQAVRDALRTNYQLNFTKENSRKFAVHSQTKSFEKVEITNIYNMYGQTLSRK